MNSKKSNNNINHMRYISSSEYLLKKAHSKVKEKVSGAKKAFSGDDKSL